MTWSCNAKANVPRKTLEIMRENGLRLLLVGYESGNQQILNNIKKGTRMDIAREFTKNAKELGITIHGTFILGLPGETPETIQQTIRFACEIDPRNDSGVAGRALSRHRALPAGAGAGLVADSDAAIWWTRSGVQSGRAAIIPNLPSAVMFQFGRGVLPEVLLPPAQDVFAGGRDAAQPRRHAAALARGRGIFPLPARRARTRLSRPQVSGSQRHSVGD